MNKLIAAGLYPLTIASGITLGYFLLYPMQLPLASILLPLGLAFILIGIMERVQPYRAQWSTAHNDVVTDTAYIGINVALREIVNIGFKLGLIGLAATMGLGTQQQGLWPVHWHPILQLIPALLIFDFFEYWYHRASHRYRFLWRFHAVHHSPRRLYFLTPHGFISWTGLF